MPSTDVSIKVDLKRVPKLRSVLRTFESNVAHPACALVCC